ncbi:N-formylglutamate amidohydrolase [Sphingobacterium griseoflavum]|uniref:N-formylglutamate amidohydrolase n=1 Tax=Sphingobacterium griseoflavum TaxID=1474952 RepID=A0ABQ3HW46_9SPHI|nr:N-formylglutamate amidohydrolase [Sphingobacterium griseoflavum]GHE33696.1 hypothetical protein GCM10017764_16140 [Sphingobacterium griseoflavum]
MPTLFEFNVRKAANAFWAFAIHDGHHISPMLESYYQLNEDERLREEDPHTGCMAELPCNQFIVRTSRFQLDINRTLEKAIYRHPEMAWGLQVYRELPPEHLLQQLQQDYLSIYKKIDMWIAESIAAHGYFIVFDIHSYNAKRKSPDEIVDEVVNPQINLGTLYNDEKWRPVIDRFMATVSAQQVLDTNIDIRENVKFKGGQLAQYLLQKYGDKGCVLSVEFRKDFMDEWTGVPLTPVIQAYKQLLMHALKDLQNMLSDGSSR